MDLAAIGRLFTRLTENHSQRMESLGLSRLSRGGQDRKPTCPLDGEPIST